MRVNWNGLPMALWVVLCFACLHSGVGETLEGYLKKLGYGVIPLERNSWNQLYVRGKLNDKSVTFLVDTGCSFTQLDKGLSKKLKTPEQAKIKLDDDVFGLLEGSEFVVMDSLEIAKVIFKNQPADSMELKAFNTSFGAILGCDFFIRNNAMLDCAAKRLYVRGEGLSSEGTNVLATTMRNSGYHPAPLKKSRGLVPLCSPVLNDEALLMLVDTGATYTIVDNQTTLDRKMTLMRTGKYIEGVKRGYSSELAAVSARSLKLEGEKLPLKGIQLGVGDMRPWNVGRTAKRMEKTDGMLGGELLAQAGAIMDFSNYQIWFVPEGR